MARPSQAWFVARSRVHGERRAEEELREAGLEAYAPCERRWRRVGRVRAERDGPLFPRYLFVSLSAERPEFHLVRGCRSVEGLVGIAGAPAPVPLAIIDELRCQQALGVFDHTKSRKISFKPGQPVRVIGGPFSGFMAEVMAGGDQRRVRVLMQAIGRGRAMPTTIDVGQIEAA